MPLAGDITDGLAGKIWMCPEYPEASVRLV